MAWGSDELGQPGNGSTANSDTPVLVRGPKGAGTLSGVTAIAAGANHSLALPANGTRAGAGFRRRRPARERIVVLLLPRAARPRARPRWLRQARQGDRDRLKLLGGRLVRAAACARTGLAATHALTIGDERFTQTTQAAGACVPRFGGMDLTLSAGSLKRGAAVRFKRAAIYLGFGIARVTARHRHGRTVFVVPTGPAP